MEITHVERTYPLVFEFLILGKATKFANLLRTIDVLKDKLATTGGKYVILKFSTNEEKEEYKIHLLQNEFIKQNIKNKHLKVD